MFNTFIDLVVASETPGAIDGENSEFTCNLYGGNIDNSFIRQWSIAFLNETTSEIPGNSSNFILLPPHNSRLVIVRHDVNIFDGTVVTCSGALNLTADTELTIMCKCITTLHCIVKYSIQGHSYSHM